MKDDKTIKSEYETTKEENIETFNLLKEENLKNYKKIKSIIKKIQTLNNVILKTMIAEEDFKQFKKEGKIHFTLYQKINKKELQQLEIFNGQFISEKILMTIPYITGGITEDTLKYFNEDFEALEEITKKRNKYQDQFYSLYDKISETNKELSKIRDSFFEDLPRTNYFDEEEGIEKNTIDLTNANTLEKFRELMTELNEAIVDEIEMFEMKRLVNSQYKFDFKYDEETQTFDFLFTKDLNLTNKYLDISNSRIENLKGEIKRLQDKLKERKEPEEILEYNSITTQQKNKLMTTEKIVPQLFMLGDKIKEKISFDLSGDSEDNFIVNCIMEQYPIQFTTGTFQTLESLMTIQNYYEKNGLQIPRNPFTTKDIIYLNKGGKVSKYTNKDIEETNEEIMSLMSAIGKLDITDFMLQYYGLSEETIVNENEAIFDSIQTEKEYNKKLDEIRKRKMEELPEENKFPLDKIKKISELKNFVNLSGIDIQYQDEKVPNDTMWYFRDERPIPLFDFIKMTGRYTMLPLVMDSYLTDTQTNNEITRTLKNVIANLRYYKNNKNRKQRMWQSFYYEGRLEGQKKDSIFRPTEAMIHIKNKEIVGKWKYQAIRTIDSLAQEMKFDDERTIGTEKEWKNKMEKTRFIDSIVDYLRKAKEDKIISDFKLYSDKEKVFNEEDYITENDRRRQKTKEKIKGIKKDKTTKQKKNPSVYKIAIIIE